MQSQCDYVNTRKYVVTQHVVSDITFKTIVYLKTQILQQQKIHIFFDWEKKLINISR